MMIGAATGGRPGETILFRVRHPELSRVAPESAPRVVGSYQLVPWIAFADRPGAIDFHVTKGDLWGFEGAVAEAVRTQAVCHADRGDGDATRAEDRPLGRVLRALVDRRFGAGEGESDARA